MIRSLVLAALLTLPSLAHAANPQVLLFNGRDLTGWQPFPAELDNFSATDDGTLRTTGEPRGYLRTTTPFASYTLDLDWRYPEKPGNSGVLLRIHGTEKVWPPCVEPQLMHGKAGDIHELGLPVERQGKKGHLPATARPEKPAGEWNHYRITFDGPTLALAINGQPVNHAAGYAVLPGFIGLQSEGAPIEFRNLHLTPLAPTPLFNGKDLTGWHVQGNGSWSVQDGVIVGKQAGDNKGYSHLVSDVQAHDFKARVVYKAVAGNSGFYLRPELKADGKMHGLQAEIDATRDAGGLYESYGRGWVAKPNADLVLTYFKPNDWNEMIVTAVGPRITVHVNGTLVSDVTEAAHDRPGPFALQLHGGQDVEVQFREIELLPLQP